MEPTIREVERQERHRRRACTQSLQADVVCSDEIALRALKFSVGDGCVVVGIEQPHRDLRCVARFDLAVRRVVRVESMHFDFP